jgi:hypothetical protein
MVITCFILSMEISTCQETDKVVVPLEAISYPSSRKDILQINP